MSWIKTNFLWMMYRCGWCSKKEQERVLAVRITRDGFNSILSEALTGRDEKERGMTEKSHVRLQWDPDHDPNGLSEARRAIQLGLRNEVSLDNIVHEIRCRLCYINTLPLMSRFCITMGTTGLWK